MAAERVTPKPGDVLRIPSYWRNIEVAEVTTHDILVWGIDRGRRVKMSLCSPSNFPAMTAKAEVLHRAD